MNTRRFARTLDDAFGPYHRSSVCPVEPMEGNEPKHRAADFALYVVAVVAMAVIYFTR